MFLQAASYIHWVFHRSAKSKTRGVDSAREFVTCVRSREAPLVAPSLKYYRNILG